MSECAGIREAIQDGMDGPLAAERREAVAAHLPRCAECRDYRDGMSALREAFAKLPPQPFPEDALQELWERTVESRGGAAQPRAAWRGIGVALALAASVTLFFLPALFRPLGTPFSASEITQADRDARRVLTLASQALRKSERAAVEQVIAGEVLPAVRKIPIRWSPSKSTTLRRPRT